MTWQAEVDPDYRDILITILRSEYVKEVRTCTSWLPRRCALTGKSLFMQDATKLYRHVPNDKSLAGSTIKETYWVCPRQWLFYRIKGPSFGR